MATDGKYGPLETQRRTGYEGAVPKDINFNPKGSAATSGSGLGTLKDILKAKDTIEKYGGEKMGR